ncbi:hypothetical protein DUNSADRAFT_10945, partial [Dunaliella salina]
AAYTDARWVNQLHGQWRSAEARELDRLGGAEREAVGRGESMKFKMKWLESGLAEQGVAIQDALAKDPNAGRHEIQRQVFLSTAGCSCCISYHMILSTAGCNEAMLEEKGSHPDGK